MSTSPTTARTGAFNLAVVAVVAGLVLALKSVVVYIPAMWVAMPARWVVIPTKFVAICMVFWEKGKWGGMMNVENGGWCGRVLVIQKHTRSIQKHTEPYKKHTSNTNIYKKHI